MHRRVLIASGSSGGHIYPALALGQALEEHDRNTEIYFATGEKTLESKLTEHLPRERLFHIPGRGYHGLRTLFNPFFWISFFKGFYASWALVRRLKPDLTVGFGGYSAFPVVLISSLSGRKTLIHEQNMKMGRANGLLTHFTRRVALSFQNEPLLERHPDKYIYTGMPLRAYLKREERAGVIRALEFSPEKKTLLIMGGSQGSEFINAHISELVDYYGDRLADFWQCIHITGNRRFSRLESIYRNKGIAHKIMPYAEEMTPLYSCADVVITRAGSSAMHECALFELPMILIPHGNARGHQSDNARVLGRQNAAIVLEEPDVNRESLLKALESLRLNPNDLKVLGRKSRESLNLEGTKRLVELTDELLESPKS